MKRLATLLLLALFATSPLRAVERSVAGVYGTEIDLYVCTISLLSDGHYLAQWHTDIGGDGTASGLWVLVGDEIRLTQKKEEGVGPPTGYLRILLLREFDGRKALLRKEDVANEKNRFFYLYLQKPPNQALERNAYVRHASCGARVTPAIAVAHL
jgi:hypothetical protein